MYDELVKRLRSEAVYLPEKFSKNAELLDVLMRAADAIEELTRRCEQFQYMPPPAWIPVTERLPSNGTNVLVFEFGRVEQAHTTTYTADGSLCWVVINGGSYHRISDADCPIKWWMPLPTPPTAEEGE